IYARYTSKEALLLAVVAEMANVSLLRLMADMAANKGNPEWVLLAFGLRIAEEWTRPREVGLYRLILSEAHRFPVLADIFEQQMARLRSPIEDYLRAQTALGVFAIPDLNGAARQ